MYGYAPMMITAIFTKASKSICIMGVGDRQGTPPLGRPRKSRVYTVDL